MNIEVSKQSAASKAFGLRKEVRDSLLSSQSTEHEYYKKIGGQVESTATYLCAYFSQMIQEQMPTWQDTKVQLFAANANIPVTHLFQWCGASINLKDTGNLLALSEELVKQRKSELANFSGTLWGAKKGMETQYASAAIALKYAESSHVATLDKYKLANTAAIKMARVVLEHCMSHSIRIAQCPVFGTGIKVFIAKAAQSASQSQLDHNHRQLRLIDDMQTALDNLKKIYESQ